jgi:hypothetical protein
MRTARRRLLACLPAALAPGTAAAFRLEPASGEIAAEYGAGCRAVGLHEALRGELDRLLEGREPPPELAERVTELSRCPFCGCGVAGARDHGEAARPLPG